MAQGPENRMLARLKPKLEQLGFYIEKTNNIYRRGTPDWYVEWDGGCGWIEAKFWNRNAPEEFDSVKEQYIFDMCSAHQKKWLTRAFDNSIPIAVLCGFKDKKFYFTDFGSHPTEPLDEEELFEALTKWATYEMEKTL